MSTDAPVPVDAQKKAEHVELPVTQQPPKRKWFSVSSLFHGVFAILVFPVSRLLPRVSPNRNECWVTSFPKIMFAWPMIPLFLLGGFLEQQEMISANLLGSLVLAFSTLTLIILTEDIDFVLVVILALFGMVLVLLGFIGETNLNIPVVKSLAQFHHSFKSKIDHGICYEAALVLTAIFCFYALPRAYYSGRYQINSRNVYRLTMFRRDQAIAGQGEVITPDRPDILEQILGFGSGTIVIQNANTNKTIRIENVWGLWFVEPRLLEIREATAVRPSDSTVDEDSHA